MEIINLLSQHFDETIGHNFGGGNTAWEEKSLGIYATRYVHVVTSHISLEILVAARVVLLVLIFCNYFVRS